MFVSTKNRVSEITRFAFSEVMEVAVKIARLHRLIVWLLSGKPDPPPEIVKRFTLKRYAKKFGLKILIETGTYRGDMVDSLKNAFEEIYSIELGQDLYLKAKDRFRKHSHIFILNGDSGKLLPGILKRIDEPCLFWLDAHYSSGITVKGDLETPILSELRHILSHRIKEHVILIDDARDFIGKNDYPSIKELSNFVHKYNSDYSFEVERDIIRIHKATQEKEGN